MIIEKQSIKPGVVADFEKKGPHNIYMIFLDGSVITSSYLDKDKYPKEDILPNLRKFLKEDAHWFPNSLSNGPETHISFPIMMSGKLYKRFDNGYHSEDIFSVLKRHYKMKLMLVSTPTLCKEQPESCVLDPLYSKPMKIFFEMYRNISTFGFYPVTSNISKLKNKNLVINLLKPRAVNILLRGAKNDTGKNNFYIIQLFYREKKQLKNFDKLMGEFFAILKDQGKYEDAIIMLVTDHGLNLNASPRYGVATKHISSVYKVPFAIKTPGVGNGKLYEYIVQSIDIAPTLLAQVLPADAYSRLEFDGVDVLRDRPVREHYISFGKKDVMYQLINGEGKTPELIEVPISQVKLNKKAQPVMEN